MLIVLLVILVLVWSVTSNTGFWPWMARQSGKRLALMIVIITLLIWAAMQIAGFGPPK